MKIYVKSWLVLLSLLLALLVFIAFAESETPSKDLVNATNSLNITNTTTNITADLNLTGPNNLTVSENLTAINLTTNETNPNNESNPFANAMGKKPPRP